MGQPSMRSISTEERNKKAPRIRHFRRPILQCPRSGNESLQIEIKERRIKRNTRKLRRRPDLARCVCRDSFELTVFTRHKQRTKQQHAPSEAPSPSLAHLHAIPPSPLRSLALPHNQLPQQHSHGQGHAPSSASHHSQSSSHRHDDTQLFDRVKRALRS